MKQLLQNLKDGSIEVVEVPYPQMHNGDFLIHTTRSLISTGTERMLLNFGKGSYLQKARQQPEKVRQVVDKIKTDGLMPTIHAVQTKLEQPLSLGYCNVGTIHAMSQVGGALSQLHIGDRVVSNGPHAEVVCVPKHLCAKIPDMVSDEEAAFTVAGAVGLEGIRLARPTLDERFVVIGLGLIGLLTVQLLQANGCRVLGIDPDPNRCALARQFTPEIVDLSRGDDPIARALAFSAGKGIDGALITASTTSNEPMHQAAQMCRQRGRIVLVGVTGLELQRSDFYGKELSFQVSCSYGPGRYDKEYEENGHDYPFGFVRWTEQRNFEAVLDLLESKKLDVQPLISHRFSFRDASKAYDLIASQQEPYIGVLLEYSNHKPTQSEFEPRLMSKSTRLLPLHSEQSPAAPIETIAKPVVGLIGAGNFTGQILLPALKTTNVRLKTIASSGGVSGTHLGKKFGFEESTTDSTRIMTDPEISTVLITTRHQTHAQFILQALQAGKHVFVEKPLCLSQQELEAIRDAYASRQLSQPSQVLMVGFNRRFAPHSVKLKTLLETANAPKSFIMTVNAGAIPATHWTQDRSVGGGRILGEVCHFIDFLRFLAGYEIVESRISRLQSGVHDTVSIQLSFADGSIGTIHYFANGNKRFPKERLEVFCEEKILQLDNFRTLRGYGWNGCKHQTLWRQDKGHTMEMNAFIRAIELGEPAPIPVYEIFEVAQVSLNLAESA